MHIALAFLAGLSIGLAVDDHPDRKPLLIASSTAIILLVLDGLGVIAL